MNGRICVGNLPLSVTKDDLQQKFAEFGSVISVAIEVDLRNGRRKSSGLVEMQSDVEAQAAISRLNMTQYRDAVISVYNVWPKDEGAAEG